MIKTEWKPEKEIEYSLRNADKISILSCAMCANLSNAGGAIGISILTDLLKEWDKEVVFSKCIMICCAEEIMKKALRKYRGPISKSDALIILSCASGIQSANYCAPKVPVIAVLDSVGIAPITRQDDPVARSICSTCGHCVITYTGSICPLSECPAKSKYGPCEKAPQNGSQCAIDPRRDCVWKEIEERGDLAALRDLRQIHRTEGENRYTPNIVGKASRPFFGELFKRIVPVKPMGLEKIIRLLK